MVVMEDLDKIVLFAKEAAKVGGDLLVRDFGLLDTHQVDLKGLGDYVTELDHRSEQEIIKIIKARFPDHGICAEESGGQNSDAPYLWYIDPLDGTANYVHQIPLFGVSIGFGLLGELIAGVVYFPMRNEMFSAIKGGGAFLNDRRIHVSREKDISKTFLATGFPWRSRPHLNAYLSSFKKIFSISGGIRRLGAACIDLAYTACGRFDGFWEMKLKPHDIAAGILLVKEAGGIVSDFEGEENYLKNGNVIAAAPFIYPEICSFSKRYLQGIE